MIVVTQADVLCADRKAYYSRPVRRPTFRLGRGASAIGRWYQRVEPPRPEPRTSPLGNDL